MGRRTETNKRKRRLGQKELLLFGLGVAGEANGCSCDAKMASVNEGRNKNKKGRE